jgi:ribosome-associated protein
MSQRSAASPPPEFDSDAERFACYAARLLADTRCEQVIVVDVRGICQVTDFLAVATGTSDRQIRSVADDLKDLGRDQQHEVFRAALDGEAGWVVIDFVDVVVHLLTGEKRAYYDLESLWGDGRMVDWVHRTTPGQFARIGAGRTTVE